jgi:hypothetical protein
MCPHQPTCPSADGPDRDAAHTVAAHPEQGWSLLCNGVIVFDDTGELLPDGTVILPHSPAPARRSPSAPRPAAAGQLTPANSGTPGGLPIAA